jgi:hypothetical protein
MIPLPFPPPLGEILVVGGVSVLGTEYEAPKRVMRNARDALQNAVESKDSEEVQMEKLQQMESVSDQDSTDKTDLDPSSPEDEEKESVQLRDSFLSVVSQQQLDEDHRGVNATSNDAPSVNDCWSDSNIDANIDNMYSGKEHDASPLPSPTKQFLTNIGRNLVLPFLDHVVGEDPEKLQSKTATVDADSENEAKEK